MKNMRKIPLILLFITAFLKLAAQDYQTEKLLLLLNKNNQQDTVRVNLLNQLTENSTMSVEQRNAFVNEALFISRKLKYLQGEGYALVNQASVKLTVGENAGSFQLLQRAYSIAEKLANRELSVSVLLAMGDTKAKTAENKHAIAYYLKAEAIAHGISDKKILANSQRVIANFYDVSLTDYPKAFEWLFKSIKTGEEANCINCLARSWAALGGLYGGIDDQTKSLVYYNKALEANKQIGDKVLQFKLLNNVGERYRLSGYYSEAIKTYNLALLATNSIYDIELIESNLAEVYVRLDNLPAAFKYAFASLDKAEKIVDVVGVAWIKGILGRAYLKESKSDSAIFYAKQGLEAADKTGTLEYMRDNCEVLSNAYVQKKDFTNAYNFQNLYISYRDSMINTRVTYHSNLLQYNYDMQKKQAQIKVLNQEKKLQYHYLLSALLVLALIAITVIVLLRANRQKQKANNLLSTQKQLIEQQRDQTDKALSELKLTQQQLIESAKMASLGELTAGIAHEIQNPLNFVNNFSEVNTELIAELKEEIDKGNIEEVQAIITTLKDNEQKINSHGQRADVIIKGMLQHSRSSTGQKEPADINALADKYLRLSYHGLQAKDKFFNADFTTSFDENIGKINIVPQDFGRVLLNLYNNAFYAVYEKKKQLKSAYQPLVSVTTRLVESSPSCARKLEICIKDNGNGIPHFAMDKIFQPFFTTKPAGQGTGLGLSISYDIITKVHNGQITVKTEEGNFSEFIVSLFCN